MLATKCAGRYKTRIAVIFAYQSRAGSETEAVRLGVDFQMLVVEMLVDNQYLDTHWQIVSSLMARQERPATKPESAAANREGREKGYTRRAHPTMNSMELDGRNATARSRPTPEMETTKHAARHTM